MRTKFPYSAFRTPPQEYLFPLALHINESFMAKTALTNLCPSFLAAACYARHLPFHRRHLLRKHLSHYSSCQIIYGQAVLLNRK